MSNQNIQARRVAFVNSQQINNALNWKRQTYYLLVASPLLKPKYSQKKKEMLGTILEMILNLLSSWQA